MDTPPSLVHWRRCNTVAACPGCASCAGCLQGGQSTPPEPLGRIFSILRKSHSLLQSGQAERVLSHLWMQSRWNTCPHPPQAMLSPGWSESPVGLACTH